MADLTLLKIPRTTIRNAGPSTLAAPSAELVQALLGFPAAAGKPVTRATAIRVAAVLASVKMLANDIAKMPLVLREQTEVNGLMRTRPAIKDPLYTILKDVPNRFQTSFEFRWYLASQLIMNGNCYAQKITDQAGDIIELIPLNAWAMETKWDYDAPIKYTSVDPRTGKKVPVLCYHYSDGNANIRKFYAQDLWHVTALNVEGNGFVGTPSIALAKEAISVLIAAEETAGRNFANGLGMGGFITFPADVEVTEEQAQNTVDRLKKDFSGSQNAGKFTALPLGAKFEKMTFSAQESQLLDSRKWNEQEVARVFGGAPLVVKLGLGESNATYASSAAFLGEYFHTSILPYTTVIEQTITRDLIPRDEWGTKYAKHNADVILYGSPTERTTVNAQRINSFQMTPNEARATEDRDAVEGGDFLCGGTGTPVIFDIEMQEFFIPGQLPPQAVMDANAEQAKLNAKTAADRLAALQQNPPKPEGDQPAPEQPKPETKKPNKAKARLEAMANSIIERVLRKESKTGPDAKFTAEVLHISLSEAEEYVAKRPALSDDDARASLLALALGDVDDEQ